MSDLRDQLQAALDPAYLLERELSGGGMSRLFLATERSLKRPVVIKLLPRELASEVSAARFHREIELAAHLRHPYILPIYAAGRSEGLLYYVMPFVPGESLRQRLEREGRLPILDAVRLLRELTDGLAYAHRSGVVHRDIKPENVLLEQGHAMIADFGIALALTEKAAAGRLTMTGMSVGTLGYMAPEQAAGDERVDARADVYALGVVGYEMLAGSSPFGRGSPQAILAAQLGGEPTPLLTLRPDVPQGVARAVERAMATLPDGRFQTAAEFREALAEPETAVISGAAAAPRSASRSGVSGAVQTAARRLLRHFRPEAPPPTAVSPTTLAVLPFSVRGSERLGYLGDGIVDLLSTRLDGAGELRVSDARAVLGVAAQAAVERTTMSPDVARAIAGRLGAGLFVLGSIVEAGGRLQVNASLYDAEGKLQTTAQAAAEEAQLFELVDELAIQLLAGRERREGSQLTRLAAATTHSLDALKSYLEGERHFRAGHYTASKEAFQRAVDADPSFALAWYRLSLAAEWTGGREGQDEAAEQALRHAGRLAEHDRQLLEAFVAWRHGDPRAEGMYRDIIGSYPSDVEAWFQLAEVLFHYGPLSGRSIAEARDAWERVLFFEPTHLAALQHLGRIASAEGRRGELEAITQRVLALSPDSERALEVRALRDFAIGDAADQQRVCTELRRAGDFTLNVTLRTVATYSGNLEGAVTLARLATEGSRAADSRALAHVQLAYLELARGRWSAAKAELAQGEALGGAFAFESRALLSALPFVPVPREEVESVCAAMTQWDPATVPRSDSRSVFLKIHNGVHCHVRAYALALLNIRLGEDVTAHRYATELEAMNGSKLGSAFARSLADAVHAHVAAARRESGTALAGLERITSGWGYDPPLASPFFSLSLERLRRADLLAAAGRVSEAMRWYNSFAEGSVYDLVYVAPSHRARAELSERSEDVNAAIAHYARFVELWSGCDTELEPITAQARRRLEELRGGTSNE